MNLGQMKDKAIMLMNSWSINGTKETYVNNADYLLRMNNFADMAQKEIATVKPILKTYKISRNPINSLIGLLGFEVNQHLSSDYTTQYFDSKSYYFEVDNVATVIIEDEQGNVLKTINNTVKGSYTAYKGNVSSSNKIRMRFTGYYPYNIRNTALFPCQFPTDDDVIDYTPYVAYDMPADFYTSNKVTCEGESRYYGDAHDFYWENNDLLLSYYFKGQVIVQYAAYPTDITDSTADTYNFELTTEAQELIPLYVAGRCYMEDNPSVATQILNEYQLRLQKLGVTITNNIENIKDVYGEW